MSKKEVAKKNTEAILKSGEIVTVDKEGNKVVLTLAVGKVIHRIMARLFGKKTAFDSDSGKKAAETRWGK